MPSFENITDQIAMLQVWATEVPRIVDRSEAVNASPKLGERHGSWFFSIDWEQGGLWRSAELALTNPEATLDDATEAVVVSVRSSASDARRYVYEVIYEKRRSTKRMSEELFQQWLAAAISRAASYSTASLTDTYRTGLGTTDQL